MQLSLRARQASWTTISSGLKLRSASGAEVEHLGTTSVWKQLENQSYAISFELAAVSGPIASLSLSWLEYAAWTFESARAGRKLRWGQEEILVLRRDGVSDDAENAETALGLCPLSAGVDDEPATQVRSMKILVFPYVGTRSADWMTHLSRRSWCDHCVKGFAMEDHHHRLDRSKATIPEVQLDYTFLKTTASQNSMVTILHAGDIETLMRVAVVRQKGGVERDRNRRELSWRAWTTEGLAEERQRAICLGTYPRGLTATASGQWWDHDHQRNPTWKLACDRGC